MGQISIDQCQGNLKLHPKKLIKIETGITLYCILTSELLLSFLSRGGSASSHDKISKIPRKTKQFEGSKIFLVLDIFVGYTRQIN